jgi:hypothetical protein
MVVTNTFFVLKKFLIPVFSLKNFFISSFRKIQVILRIGYFERYGNPIGVI